jgi:hypothetical protein
VAVRTRDIIRTPAFLLPVLCLGGLFLAAGFFEGSQGSGERWLAVLVPEEGLEGPGPAESHLYPDQSRLVTLTLKDGTVLVDEIAPHLRITAKPAVSYDGKNLLFSAREGISFPSRIWESRADGSGLRRLGAGDADCVDPAYLPDGSIVFGCVVNEERSVGGVPSISLYRLASARGAPERITFGRSRDRIQGILPDGRILYRRWEGGDDPGTLMAVRPDGTEMARYVSAPPSPDPFDPPPGAPVQGRPEMGPHGNPASDPPVFHREGRRVADLVAIRPSPPPPVATSVVDTSKPYGYLLCLDAKTSDVPSVRDAVDIAEVRVLDGRSATLLGRASVEEDGSFFLRVPADRPLLLELIDGDGVRLAGQRNEIWVRPNETRGCVGCHESRVLAPENRLPMAIRRQPTPIGGGSGEAGDEGE